MFLFTKRYQKIYKVGNWRYFLKDKVVHNWRLVLSGAVIWTFTVASPYFSRLYAVQGTVALFLRQMPGLGIYHWSVDTAYRPIKSLHSEYSVL